tara:strand:+ start:1365 stop:1862 length:498 start_codon:yes stop_codon:yes gene_type:complete
MGLKLSSSYQNQDFFDPKSNFRKAGEIFTPQNSSNNSSKSRAMITDLYNEQDSSVNNSSDMQQSDSSSDSAQSVDSSSGWQNTEGRDFTHYENMNGKGEAAYKEDMDRAMSFSSTMLSPSEVERIRNIMRPDYLEKQKGGSMSTMYDYSMPRRERMQKMMRERRF